MLSPRLAAQSAAREGGQGRYGLTGASKQASVTTRPHLLAGRLSSLSSRNRMAVAIDWLWLYLIYHPGARLITGGEM
jgi:hypothetical protein